MFKFDLGIFILPWLDKSPIRSGKFRPMFKIFFWVLFIDCLVLGYVGGKPAEGVYLTVGRVATIWYFIHFLIVLPLLTFIETPKPLPHSISKPIIGGGGRMASSTTIKWE